MMVMMMVMVVMMVMVNDDGGDCLLVHICPVVASRVCHLRMIGPPKPDCWDVMGRDEPGELEGPFFPWFVKLLKNKGDPSVVVSISTGTYNLSRWLGFPLIVSLRFPQCVAEGSRSLHRADLHHPRGGVWSIIS